MSLKILMFGETGQVATEMRRRAGPDLVIEALGRQAADLTDPEACAARIAATDANVVVNAAAYTAVDQAEEDLATAMVVNAEAPGAMAAAAASRGLPFLHISTDYVFDGSGTEPWSEDAPTAPLGVYGLSKLAGEERVTAAGGPHAILRTAWVHAAHGKNFLRTMLRLGAERDRLTIVEDQRGGPTAAGDIADALITMAGAQAERRGPSGIYHFCGAPAVSWHGFATAIFEAAGMADRVEVAPIPSSAFPTKAPRPANSVLNCSKIHADYGILQPDWRQSMARILADLADLEGKAP
ncbi:MAG: dTDP-4-dehydrorhamnose reductase [Pseudomonadota bacterium]